MNKVKIRVLWSFHERERRGEEKSPDQRKNFLEDPRKGMKKRRAGVRARER